MREGKKSAASKTAVWLFDAKYFHSSDVLEPALSRLLRRPTKKNSHEKYVIKLLLPADTPLSNAYS